MSKKIIYLSGSVQKELAKKDHIGFMLTPNLAMRASCTVDQIWAADTGCYTQPNKYSNSRYFSWLSAQNPSTCLFATAPDVLGNARATLDRSAPVLAALRNAGFKAALVAQNGLEHEIIPWESLDCLFIGGTTEWKLGVACAKLIEEAVNRQKWVHMGRVNSFKRLRSAQALGCDSADGTHVAFSPQDQIETIVSWLERLNFESGSAISKPVSILPDIFS
jgi:hypothetical protein